MFGRRHDQRSADARRQAGNALAIPDKAERGALDTEVAARLARKSSAAPSPDENGFVRAVEYIQPESKAQSKTE